MYAITDNHLIHEINFHQAIKSALQGGANIIQYRDKTNDAEKHLVQTLKLRELCDQHDALLIINDDIQLTIASKADGVHLGKNDVSVAKARKLLGGQYLIGQSCYNDIDSAIDAELQGADYVAFGAVYNSPTKPDAATVTLETLKNAKPRLSIPVCAIGGINIQNARPVIATGIDMIAVISDLFTHKNIQERSEALSSLFR